MGLVYGGVGDISFSLKNISSLVRGGGGGGGGGGKGYVDPPHPPPPLQNYWGVRSMPPSAYAYALFVYAELKHYMSPVVFTVIARDS